MRSLTLTILAFFVSLTTVATAQTTNLVDADSSWMKIEGTSTIHDWEADVNELNASYTLAPEEDVPVSDLSFTIPVKSIKSGKGGMDRRIYDAFKSDDHPQISFRMTEAKRTEGDAGSITLEVTGELAMAGVSKTVTLPVKGEKSGSGWLFTGSHSLNMADYDMDPPSAMFGTIKSGEKVTVAFNLIVNNQNI